MRRMLLSLLAVLTLAPLLLPVSAFPSHECARVGDTMSMVLGNCGEPTLVDSMQQWRTQLIPPGAIYDGWYIAKVPIAARVPVEVEVWTYNLGRTKFMRIFTFENGILHSITTGGYGR